MLDDFLAILYREDGAAVLFNEKLLDLHIEFVILRQQDAYRSDRWSRLCYQPRRSGWDRWQRAV